MRRSARGLDEIVTFFVLEDDWWPLPGEGALPDRAGPSCGLHGVEQSQTYSRGGSQCAAWEGE